jgi:HTH-type transcriptional regulator/antitoxin HigA
MEKLKYKIITSAEQYDEYCQIHHDLAAAEGEKTQDIEDELELLYWLIRKWDDEHTVFHKEYDAVDFLKSFMKDHKMKAKDIAELLDVNKSYISEILNYKKGFSKNVIRKLAQRFKVREEAFSRPYKLKGLAKAKRRSAKTGRSVKTKKKAA